jgi:hypothetical protein
MGCVVVRWCFVLVLACSSRAFAQDFTLYTENFETGAPAWSKTDLWNVTSAPNQCGGMASKAAEFNNPATCTYFVSVTPHTGDLISPATGVFLAYTSPTISFMYKMLVDAGNGDACEIDIRDAGTGGWTVLANSGWDTSGHLVEKKIFIAAAWIGHTVQFRFRFRANGVLDNTLGWVIDDVRVTSDPPPPTIIAVSPNHGPNVPGMSNIVVTGSSFTTATGVMFGPNRAAFTVVDDSHLSVTLTPTTTYGFVDVSVLNAGGTGTKPLAYDYFVPPTQIGVPCGPPTLTWSGSPTLGQTFTTVTQNLGAGSQVLLVDWSGDHSTNTIAFAQLPNCAAPPCLRYAYADTAYPLGNNATFNLPVPNLATLVGKHLRVQAIVYGCPRLSTQALDAVIGM